MQRVSETPDGQQDLAALASVGLLSKPEMSAYDQAFADDPAFRELAADLNDLAAEAAVASLEPADPPADLKHRLLEEIGPDHAPENPLEALAIDPAEAVVLTNLKGRIQWVSPAFTEMCGYSLEELRGRKPGALLQGRETDPATVERIREAVREHRPITVSLRNYAKGGDAYWVSLSISPVVGPDGQPRGYIAIEKELSSDEAAAQELS